MLMAEEKQVLESLNAAEGLRVEFVWRTDRFGHVISWVDSNGGAVPLLESMEGRADDPWPESPPLQSLSLETLPGGQRVALLVGMAGRSHWSASIEPVTLQAALQFDVACRIGGGDPALGSCYRPAAGCPSVRFSGAGDRSWLEATYGDFSLIITRIDAERLPAVLQRDERALVILPQIAPGVTKTARWRYRIELFRDQP